MIKSLAKKTLRKFGLQITSLPKQPLLHSSLQKNSNQPDRSGLAERLAEDPRNANLHLLYAIDASKKGRPYLAYAELKTAEYLGVDREQIEKYSIAFRQALPSPTSMSHNRYFRILSLSSEIVKRANQSSFSILDVGGDCGQLASFIPDALYCLAEPRVNGISGTDLPFPDDSFDYVVSCHVLEHIPVGKRRVFLDQLCSKAKQGVILLNPFHVEGTHVEERLKLVIEITDAQWAKEHLDCHLPKLQDIRDYAKDRGLQFCAKPNGTIATSMAFIFLEYFAAKSGLHEDLKKVNTFFNEKYTAILDSAEYPTAYLIYLGWPEGRRAEAEQSASEDG